MLVSYKALIKEFLSRDGLELSPCKYWRERRDARLLRFERLRLATVPNGSIGAKGFPPLPDLPEHNSIKSNATRAERNLA